MKVTPRTLLVALSVSSAFAFSASALAEDNLTEVTNQHQTTGEETESAANSTAPAEPSKVADDQTPYLVSPPSTSGGTKTIGNVTKVPVTGAFGIRLGAKFAPAMVKKVLSQEDKTYRARDENKTEHTGILYRVEPSVPSVYFNEYSVLTNKDGIIYSITGHQNPAEKNNACKKSKEVEDLLFDKYGKPRGGGVLREWFSFRESEEGPYRGIRVYAQRCRAGRYTVVYSDDGALMQESSSDSPAVVEEGKGATAESAGPLQGL